MSLIYSVASVSDQNLIIPNLMVGAIGLKIQCHRNKIVLISSAVTIGGRRGGRDWGSNRRERLERSRMIPGETVRNSGTKSH